MSQLIMLRPLIVKESIVSHDGPNIYDTMAETEFELGNYQNAPDNQLKAVDFFAAGGGSPYWTGVKVLVL